jgi:hypothetical protein
MDAASSTSGRGAVISVAAKRERCGSSVDEESHCSLLSDDEESHGKEDGGGADGRGRNKRAKQVSSATLDALRQALPEPIKKVTGKGGKNTNLSYTLHSKMFHGIGAAAEHASKCIVCPLEVRRAAVKYQTERNSLQAEVRLKVERQTSMDTFVRKGARVGDEDVDEVIGELIVEQQLPLSFVESPTFAKLLSLYALRGTQRGTPYEAPSRRSVGRLLYEGDSSLLRKFELRDTAVLKQRAADVFLTAATDGRKGVRGEANEAFYLLALDEAYLSSTTDFALETKSADNYVSYFWEEMGRAARRFGMDVYELVFALVTDRGGACRVGRQRLQEERGILSVSCKSHEGALAAKKVTASVHYLQENVVELINVVHLFSYSQAGARLRNQNISLGRVVETRFLYLVQLAVQVRKQHEAINGICQSLAAKSLHAWVQGQDVEHQNCFNKAKTWLSKAETVTFLDFFIEVSGPFAVITREMDRSRANLFILHPLWGAVSETLGTIFGKPKYNSVPLATKQDIAGAVMDFWTTYSEPADTASYMMTPQFWPDIRKLQLQDPEEYDLLKDDLEVSVRVFLRTRDLRSKVRNEVLAEDDEMVTNDWLEFLDEYEKAIAKRENFDDNTRGSLGFALAARLRQNADKPPYQLYADTLTVHRTVLHGPGVALTTIVPVASAVERAHKDERDTRTPARSSTTREHTDMLIRARQSLKRNGGLRSVEEIVGYRHDDVAVAVASSSRAPPSPFQVLRDFSKLSEIEERWLDDYTAMCDEAERAVARGVCRARRQAAVMDGFDDGDDEEQPRDLDTARAIIDEGVHGPVEEPSTNGRPKRRAAQALQAYLRAGAANGML